MVFSARTGFPEMVLADNGWLTDKRTAAAACAAAGLLCRKAEGGVTMGVIGCGIQAKMQMAMIRDVLDVRVFKCWSRTEKNLNKLVADMRDEEGIAVEKCASAEEAVRDCDLVSTCTASRSPLVFLAGLSKHATLVCVGSDTPGKREVDGGVVDHLWENGGKVVVDTRENVRKLGEMQWHGERVDDVLKCATLGDVITEKSGGRAGDEMILVDLTGVGAQDASISNEVVEAWLKKEGKGKEGKEGK